MFENIRLTVEAGGGRVEDIIKVTFWMETLVRKPINDEWVKMFPDADARPARQVMEVAMEPDVLVQCDFMAVLPS
jgi:enamine deaminase RidA (YjgF/YER057c/UK114 family)